MPRRRNRRLEPINNELDMPSIRRAIRATVKSAVRTAVSSQLIPVVVSATAREDKKAHAIVPAQTIAVPEDNIFIGGLKFLWQNKVAIVFFMIALYEHLRLQQEAKRFDNGKQLYENLRQHCGRKDARFLNLTHFLQLSESALAEEKKNHADTKKACARESKITQRLLGINNKKADDNKSCLTSSQYGRTFKSKNTRHGTPQTPDTKNQSLPKPSLG